MPKLRGPLLSLNARGRLGELFSLARRMGQNIIEKRPIPVDAKSPAQLFYRQRFSDCVAKWHLLSEAEQKEWNRQARHMTGYPAFMSYCLALPPALPVELERQVETSTDDCLRWLTSSYWNLTHPSMLAGASSATTFEMGSGMRFTNITIPNGAIITEAHLTLRCSVARTGETVNTRISAEDVDNAPTFADDRDAFDTRWANRTAARVDWDAIPVWSTGTNYDSPDIKTVIQEIVDRPGWNSGQDIVIFWEDFEDRSSHTAATYRQCYSYDGSVEFASKLFVTYEAAS